MAKELKKKQSQSAFSEQEPDSQGDKKWIKALDKVVEAVIIKLKRRELVGSGTVATQTVELLRTVVSRGKFSSIQELLDTIRAVGKRLSDARPTEMAIGNMVRRVLYVVRRELAQSSKEQKEDVDVDISLSLHKLLDKAEDIDYKAPLPKALKAGVIDEMSSLMEEVRTVYLNISEQAVEHIFAGEVILTYGISRTVTAFLKEAAKFRKFEVIVAESAPSYEGQKQALALSQAGIDTTLITDSAVFAMLRVVNKVIIGTHAVMANGGLICHTGGYNIAVAAKLHSIPVVVLAGLHKLCPLYAFDQDTFNEQNPPSQILGFEEDFDKSGELVDVLNPAYDYVSPDLVTLFLTNFGAHAPSYIYRLLAEYYNPQDYSL